MRGTTAEWARRPSPASGSVLIDSISSHVDDVESGHYLNVYDNPSRKTGSKRKATDSHLDSAHSKRSRSLGTGAATITPAGPMYLRRLCSVVGGMLNLA